MSLIKYGISVPGNSIASYCQEYDAGGTFAPMDVVKYSSGTIVVAAENDTAALGWAITAGASGSKCLVLKAEPGVKVNMPSYGTEAVTNKGVNYALKGTTGAQTVDISDTGNDLFVTHEVDIDNELLQVSILPAASQAQTGS